jgi:hypothetical protein
MDLAATSVESPTHQQINGASTPFYGATILASAGTVLIEIFCKYYYLLCDNVEVSAESILRVAQNY